MTILAQMMMKLLHEKVYNLLAFKKMPNKSMKIKSKPRNAFNIINNIYFFDLPRCVDVKNEIQKEEEPIPLLITVDKMKLFLFLL